MDGPRDRWLDGCPLTAGLGGQNRKTKKKKKGKGRGAWLPVVAAGDSSLPRREGAGSLGGGLDSPLWRGSRHHGQFPGSECSPAGRAQARPLSGSGEACLLPPCLSLLVSPSPTQTPPPTSWLPTRPPLTVSLGPTADLSGPWPPTPSLGPCSRPLPARLLCPTGAGTFRGPLSVTPSPQPGPDRGHRGGPGPPSERLAGVSALARELSKPGV